MSDDPASVEAWQEEENWCKKNGWDLLTYLRGKPVIITKDALGQAVPDYKATEVVRTLTKQHQERCEMAANEIERLRKQRDDAMVLVETIAHDVSVLSTRPAAIIKFTDLVDRINEWGDTARNILDKKKEHR